MLRPHTRYRHDRMKDVDFYPTRVTTDAVYGYWIHRSTGGIMHREADKLKAELIKTTEWKEVSDDGF